MINHVRNHLLNRKNSMQLGLLGEEFIPTTFVPRVLDSVAARSHMVLFGKQPDATFSNVRALQLCRLLHASKLVDDVTFDDNRLTYIPFDEGMFTNVFKATVTDASPGAMIHVMGTHTANPGIGQSLQIWEVEILAGDTARVTQKRSPFATALVPTDVTNSLTQPIPLQGSNLSVRFSSPQTGHTATITSYAAPPDDLADMLERLVSSVSANGVHVLFPEQGDDRILRWRQVWNSNRPVTDKAAATLLALARHIETLPMEEA